MILNECLTTENLASRSATTPNEDDEKSVSGNHNGDEEETKKNNEMEVDNEPVLNSQYEGEPSSQCEGIVRKEASSIPLEQFDGNEVGGKSRKDKVKVKKSKSTSFSCRYCDNRFPKTTQLTHHMKTCHTSSNEIPGNAITVSTPIDAFKHFFCHCAICGDGYDSYGQLNSHEREKHNYSCDECEENFMTQLDLTSHISAKHTKHYQCNVCEESFIRIDGLAIHKETVHRKNMDDESCQTDTYDCENCATHIKKAQFMEILEKEHIDLKNVHTRLVRILQR